MNGISKKLATQILLLILILSALFCIICWWDAKKVTIIDINNYTKITDLTYELEDIILQNDILKIRGWVIQDGLEVETYDIAMLLYNPMDNTLYELPTQYEKRTDVTTLINDGTNYDDSGFLSNTLIKQFNLSQYQYELCIAFRNNDCKFIFHSDQYIGGNWNTINISRIDANNYMRSNNLQCGIEEVNLDNDILTVNGWIVHRGKESMNSDISVTLYNLTDKSFFVLPTEYKNRTDVTEFINDEINYDDSGFQTSISIQQLNPTQVCYEICILYRNQETTYLLHTGQYVGGSNDGQ